MNLEIQKIRLNELEDFIESKYFRGFEFIPISPIRAKSYLANPHAQANDVVLYLGFIEKRLVAFRTLFADVVFLNNEKTRFAWCSGAWVHPHFRKKGFSEQLLKEAYSDWNQKLMFTNYTSSSEKLIQKTGWFKSIYQFKGARAYLFPKTKKLLARYNSNVFLKILFSVIDLFIVLFSSIRLWFYRKNKNSKYSFKTIDFTDKQCYQLLNNKTNILKRGEKELNWIINNPWISSNKNNTFNNYPFSSYSKEFYYKTVKIFLANNFIGFFIFSVREGHLKTLYWNVPIGIEKEIAEYLKNFCKRNKIEIVSIYKKELATELFKRKFPFLHVKKYGQKIYSTFEPKRTPQNNYQDGDGDVFFT